MHPSRDEFHGKHVAVLGIARTGLASARVLRELGAEVVLSDQAGSDRLAERLAAARALGVTVLPGASAEAALAGAELVVPSPGIPAQSDVLQLAVRKGIPILSEIEIAYRISKAPILAVTATNGKTTTTVWLADMLKRAGGGVWVAGNIAADELKCTLIDAASRASCADTLVAEVSSFQLEWVERFRPRVGILLNITPDHLNRHGTFTEYAACKARLFRAQEPGDVAVVNSVNAPARSIGARLTNRVLWFDRGHCGARDWACVRDGQITVRWGGAEHTLAHVNSLQVPGSHNVENALAAAGAAIAAGCDPEHVRSALLEFTGVPHRMEPVAERGGVAYINNSMCTNIDAAVRSIEAVGRPVVLIAGGVSKGTGFGPLGVAIARHVRKLVLIGQAADEIDAAARSAGFSATVRAASMSEAVETARRTARQGDAVMLAPACASFDMYADFEERGEAFRAAVRAALARER